MESPRSEAGRREKRSVPSPAEFDALYDRYKGLVFKYSYYLTRDRTEAEELFQETWLRVVRNYGEIQGDADRLKPWLCTITANLYKDSLRRKKARIPAGGGDSLPQAARSSSSSPDDHEAVDSAPGPEQEAENAVLARRIDRALDRLPESQRRVFLLKEVEGLRLDEIAAVLGIPLGTVKSLGFRAVQALRRSLSEQGLVKGKDPCDAGILRAV